MKPLRLEEDDDHEEIFIPSAHGAKPGVSSVPRDEKKRVTASPVVCLDMQTDCKHVASTLNIPWPEVVAETDPVTKG